MTRRLAVVAAVVMVALVAAPAAADDLLRIDRVELEEDGSSRLVFTVPAGTGSPDVADLTLLEDGEPVDGLTVQPLGEVEESEPVTLAVAFDVSGSTAGPVFDAARAAASSLVADVVGRGVDVALVAFGDQASLLAGPTDDLAQLQAVIDGLTPGGNTALNDAVLLAARTLVDLEGDRRVLVFTDGRDDGSTTLLGTVVEAVRLSGMPVSSVVLETADTDVAPLQALADAAGGSVATVATAAELGAAFDTVTAALPSVHELTWTSRTSGDELALRLELATGGATATDDALVANPRRRVATPPQAVALPDPGTLASPDLLPWGLGALGFGLALALAMLLMPRGDQRTAATLQAAVAAVDDRQLVGSRPSDGGGSLPSRLTERMADAIEALPQEPTRTADLELRLERAGWTLRPAEFQVARLAAVVIGFVLVAGLAQHLVFGLGAGAIGWLVPGLLASRAHAQRQAAFVEQMPDVLQLVSGSLKAGYGLVQAIDLVVQESDEPIAGEFRRVLNEHLLGLELEDALDGLATRIDSEDLRWVVVAMNIQRRVGGNLAELLDIVATVLRERGSVRRHVRALSAEGRLSGQVLVALPIVMGAYLFVGNRSYIEPLITDSRGLTMLGIAGVLMLVGVLWMRRLVDVEV